MKSRPSVKAVPEVGKKRLAFQASVTSVLYWSARAMQESESKHGNTASPVDVGAEEDAS